MGASASAAAEATARDMHSPSGVPAVAKQESEPGHYTVTFAAKVGFTLCEEVGRTAFQRCSGPAFALGPVPELNEFQVDPDGKRRVKVYTVGPISANVGVEVGDVLVRIVRSLESLLPSLEDTPTTVASERHRHWMPSLEDTPTTVASERHRHWMGQHPQHMAAGHSCALQGSNAAIPPHRHCSDRIRAGGRPLDITFSRAAAASAGASGLAEPRKIDVQLLETVEVPTC
jgi:hypothetical protein